MTASLTEGRQGRPNHPAASHEALLQQARAFQASPAFAEARRPRQVVEHRSARLVQLGMRQARYVGRAKTLFQVCLAAAVANLTLQAATSGTLSSDQLQAGSRLVVAFGTLLSLLFSLISASPILADSASLHRLLRPAVPLIRPLQAPSRPAF